MNHGESQQKSRNYKRNQKEIIFKRKEIIELKNAVSRIKNYLDEFNSRLKNKG